MGVFGAVYKRTVPVSALSYGRFHLFTSGINTPVLSCIVHIAPRSVSFMKYVRTRLLVSSTITSNHTVAVFLRALLLRLLRRRYNIWYTVRYHTVPPRATTLLHAYPALARTAYIVGSGG